MEEGIQQLLRMSPGAVAALVGSRIYPLLLPDESSLPAATYQRISTMREYTSTGPVSLSRVRLQIDSWAQTYGEVRALSLAIRQQLEGFTGTLPDGTWVDSIQQDSCSDLYDSVALLYRVSSDFLIFAAE